MIKLICDRCGKEITGSVCYTVEIKQMDILSSVYSFSNFYDYNSSNLLNSLVNNPFSGGIPHYCEDCGNKINVFIQKGGEEDG